MGDWQAIRLGDFAPFQYGKALPERNRRPGNVAVYGSNGVVGSHDTPLIDRSMVVIGRKGSIGEVHFSPQGGWPIDTTFYVTAGQGRDIRFTYYLLRTLGMQHMSSDSAVPGLNREAAHNLVVQIPPLCEQRAIAEVLGALDDKIEANRKLAERSDELAAALVSNTARARRQVEEVATVIMGQSPPGSTYNEEGIGLPFYQGRRDFGFRSPVPRVWCSAPSRIAEPDDVLVSVRAPVGSLNVATETCAIGRGIAALRSTNFPSVLYHVLAADSSVWHPYESEGTVFGSIGRSQLQKMVIEWPTGEISELEKVIKPLDKTVAAATEENSALANLRDTLLPKLMSGELRVRDAERLVEDAV